MLLEKQQDQLRLFSGIPSMTSAGRISGIPSIAICKPSRVSPVDGESSRKWSGESNYEEAEDYEKSSM